MIALYHQLKKLGAFDGINDVIELGSQKVWCPHRTLISRLFEAYGRPPPSEELLQSFENWTGSARALYEALGMTYQCVDSDGEFGALVLDINKDSVPLGHKCKYDLVTNHGTTEHLINQLNAFQMIHDFTRAGGIMIHAVPFIGQFDHGFFSYHPNFFDALARYNGYETLGVWLGLDWQQASFIPWHPGLLELITLTPKTTGLLVVVHRKRYPTDFCIPFQGIYEETKQDDVSENYCFVVDGDYYDGRRDKFITKHQIVEEYIEEQVRLRSQPAVEAAAPIDVAPPVAAADPAVPIDTDDTVGATVLTGPAVEDTRTIDLAKIILGRLAQRLGIR